MAFLHWQKKSNNKEYLFLRKISLCLNLSAPQKEMSCYLMHIDFRRHKMWKSRNLYQYIWKPSRHCIDSGPDVTNIFPILRHISWWYKMTITKWSTGLFFIFHETIPQLLLVHTDFIQYKCHMFEGKKVTIVLFCLHKMS